jgi:hypothetical protein
MSPRLVRAARPLPWLAFALALGLGLRAYHYLRDPAVWHDEAALILNALGKSFPELLGPLFYSEAAPPLFLWAERAVALTLGDSTFALRLLPFLAGCAAFVGAVALARRLLSPWGAVWFALLLGCSDRLLFHCCEAKPYAVDVLVAVGLLATFVCRRGEGDAALCRQLLLYAALSPLLVFLSFPACFLLGGAALALLPAVLRARAWRVWGAYAAFGVLLGGSFLLLATGPVRAQRNERLLGCWAENFPDWETPWAVPFRGAVRLTETFRYASEPTGNVLIAFAVVGAVGLWRSGQRRVLGFLLLPLGLTALAWLLGQYPFGPLRVVVFAAPAALLLVAAGVPPVLTWLGRRALPVAVAVAVFVLFPVGQAGYRAVVLWQRLDSRTPSQFVLARRQPQEPVAGLRWEHAYYFRRLGPLYRLLDPQPTEMPAPAATSGEGLAGVAPRRLWVVGDRLMDGYRHCLEALTPPGAWRVAERHEFADSLVLCLERRADAGGGPDGKPSTACP